MYTIAKRKDSDEFGDHNIRYLTGGGLRPFTKHKRKTLLLTLSEALRMRQEMDEVFILEID